MLWFRFFALAIAAVWLDAAGSPPGELRDLEPPVEMPADPVWHLYLAGAACVLLVAGAIVLTVRRRRPPPVVHPIPPQQTALAALDELERASEDPRVFYIRLVDILRSYVAARFDLRKPDDTASELMTALFEAVEISEEHQRLLREIISESDLVKFAARLPAPDAPAQSLSACRKFIREMTPDPGMPEDAHAL